MRIFAFVRIVIYLIMVYLNFNVMDCLFDFLATLSVQDVQDDTFRGKQVSCTVPHAALSPAEIFRMYSRGVPIPALPDVKSQPYDPNYTGYIPTDPSEVRQLAADALASEYSAFQKKQLNAAVDKTPLQPTSPVVSPTSPEG